MKKGGGGRVIPLTVDQDSRPDLIICRPFRALSRTGGRFFIREGFISLYIEVYIHLTTSQWLKLPLNNSI